ncbi:hypothetical protein SB752_31940, partial [Brevibacillus sp. SIMBA_040]
GADSRRHALNNRPEVIRIVPGPTPRLCEPCVLDETGLRKCEACAARTVSANRVGWTAVIRFGCG